MSFCSNCGKEIVENVKFCSACGTKVTSVDEEIVSSSNDKQEEKVFFKYIGVGKELVISSELIKCSYMTSIGVKTASIIPRNINSFEYKSNATHRILGVVMILSSFIPLFGLIGKSLTNIGLLILTLWFLIFFVIGLCYLLVKPQIEIFSGATKYLLPASTFGSKEELLNAIQSAVSYKK